MPLVERNGTTGYGLNTLRENGSCSPGSRLPRGCDRTRLLSDVESNARRWRDRLRPVSWKCAYAALTPAAHMATATRTVTKSHACRHRLPGCGCRAVCCRTCYERPAPSPSQRLTSGTLMPHGMFTTLIGCTLPDRRPTILEFSMSFVAIRDLYAKLDLRLP